MQTQASGSNPLSGSILCPSVRPVVCGTFSIFVLVLNIYITRERWLVLLLLLTVPGSSVAMSFTHTRVWSIPVQSSWYCMSIYIYACIYLSLVVHIAFLRSKCVARDCVQRMRLQATGSNTLSFSIICPSIYLFVCGPFTIFYLYSIVLILGRDD